MELQQQERSSSLVQLFEIIFTSLNVVIYSLFIVFTLKLLKRQNQELDHYMKTSLTLFGLSIIALFIAMICDNIPNAEYSATLLSRVSQDCEKSAIFLDIARLTMLVVALKSDDENLPQRIRLSKIIFGIWITLFVLIAATEIVVIILYEKNNTFIETWESSYQILYNYVFNGVIILAYLVLSFILYVTYSKVKSSYKALLTEHEAKQINENLQSILLLFISIVQLCIFRITYQILSYNESEGGDPLNYHMNSPIFYVSKFLMTLGYSISLYLRFMSAGITSAQSVQQGQDHKNQNSKFVTIELLGRDGCETDTPFSSPNYTHGRQINSLLPGAIINLNLYGSFLSNETTQNQNERNESSKQNRLQPQGSGGVDIKIVYQRMSTNGQAKAKNLKFLGFQKTNSNNFNTNKRMLPSKEIANEGGGNFDRSSKSPYIETAVQSASLDSNSLDKTL